MRWKTKVLVSAARKAWTIAFWLFTAGNMGLKQGLDVVLGAAELSRGDEGIDYLLVGDGAAHASLEKRAAARALSNVHFMPLQPHAEFMALLAATDVSLITQQRVVANIVFPSKTLTLMAAGRPVIASVNSESEVARVVRKARAGLVVEPENPSALFDAVKALRNDAHGEAGDERPRATVCAGALGPQSNSGPDHSAA